MSAGTVAKHPQESSVLRIDRGPNWLLVKLAELTATDNPQAIADQLWDVCERHFTYRLSVETSSHTALPDEIVKPLKQLGERLAAVGGALRICDSGETRCQILSGSHFSASAKPSATLVEESGV